MSTTKIKSILEFGSEPKRRSGTTYPTKMMFGENGNLSIFRKKPDGFFYQWDVGTYEMKGNTRVKISCANDSIVSYQIRFSKEGSAFTITVDNTCN